MEQLQTDVATTRARAWRRWEPLTGAAFAVLFLAAVIMLNTPSDGDSNQTWHNYFADRGNRALVLVAGFVMVASALCLLAFLTTLWTRIAAARRPEVISPLPLVAAGLAAAGIALGAIVAATAVGAMIFGSAPEPGTDTLRLLNDMSFPFISVGGMSAALVGVAALTVQAFAAGVIGRRLRAFGVVVAVGMLGSVFFFPIALLLIWTLVMTVVLLRRPAVPAAPSEAPAAAQLTGAAIRTPAEDGTAALR